MTNEDIIKEIDAAAISEAGEMFVNIFVSQVNIDGKRNNRQAAVDHFLSSVRTLQAFAADVTNELSEKDVSA